MAPDPDENDEMNDEVMTPSRGRNRDDVAPVVTPSGRPEDILYPAREAFAPHEINTWFFTNGTKVAAPPNNATNATIRADAALEVGYLMEALRQCRSSGARKIVEANKTILRTMNIKITRTAGATATTYLNLSRNQTLEAIAAHLVLPQINVRPCDSCVSGNKGPFADCISFGKEYFGGACSCCHYTSQAAKCSFHKNQKGNRYATMSEEELEALEEARATREMSANDLEGLNDKSFDLLYKRVVAERVRRDREDAVINKRASGRR